MAPRHPRPSSSLPPVTKRWARFGPNDARWFMHVPEGGVCLSAFLLVRDRSGGLLLGRPKPHPAWAERGCLPDWRVDQLVQHADWVLPASHLLMGEAPDRAGTRIARDWAGLRGAKPHLVGIDSARMPTGRRARKSDGGLPIFHWALGFGYEVDSNAPAPKGPWWAETRFFPLAELRRLPIGREHRDFLRYLSGPGTD